MKSLNRSKKFKLKIGHIAKVEGRIGLEVAILKDNISSVKLQIKEGARLIEGILTGRKIEEVPEIVSRICGVCPVAHNLAAIKAIEKALLLDVPYEVNLLRKLMMCAQIVTSHIFHIFFLALSDYFDLKDSLMLSKKYPKEFKEVIKIRNFSNRIIETICGREIHPITSILGGFYSKLEKEKLKRLLEISPSILESAVKLSSFFKKIEFFNFSRKTEYISLKNKKEYGFYEGEIVSSDGLSVNTEEIRKFQELNKIINLSESKEKEYFTGALARLNNSSDQIKENAKEILQEIKINYNNPFYNLLAQMIEVVHFIEKIQELLKEVLKISLKKLRVNYKLKENEGIGVIEAPRGILIHKYKINKYGKIEIARIVTPTFQFLPNLERDLKNILPLIENLDTKQRRKIIKMLVRSYDLCISCAIR